MPYYKNQESSTLYWLDAGVDPIQYLPNGSIELSPEDAEVLRLSILATTNPPLDAKSVITQKIDQLERSQLMPRATREFMLLFMEGNFTVEQLALNPGYQAVKAFDNSIIALRVELSLLNNAQVVP